MGNLDAITDFVKAEQDIERIRRGDFPLQPFEDIVIIEPDIEEQHSSGLILAGGAEKLSGGRVVASGPGRYYFAPMNASQNMEAAIFVKNEVRVGDWVTFGKYQSGGEPIEFEGKKYLMARAGDLGGRSRDGKPLILRPYREK